jgi:hypothetical protein
MGNNLDWHSPEKEQERELLINELTKLLDEAILICFDDDLQLNQREMAEYLVRRDVTIKKRHIKNKER